MKRIFLALTGLALLIGIRAGAQSEAAQLQQLRIDVVYLASDLLAGREAGKEGEQLAAQYIASRFEEIGLKPYGVNGAWFQSFDFMYKSNPHAAAGEARVGKNVLAYLDNGADKTVVIGAHYDHLGMGDIGTLHKGEPDIHNGADDNASGVASLLYIAEELAKGKAKQNNYLFMAFSAEELGLVGSKYWVEHPTMDLANVNYMLNMDMVGRLNDEKVLSINGVGTSPVWKELLEKIDVAGISIQTTDSGVGASDHTSFYLADLPALHFFTGLHTEYHRPSDDAPLINFTGIKEVSDYILAVVEQLDGSEKLAFSKTKDDTGRRAASFKVSLGVMPDYVYSGGGMRIDGVLDGRPAAEAGLQKGDIILKIGDLGIKDIYDYMEGLGKFKAGDKTQIVIKRGQEELTRDVQF